MSQICPQCNGSGITKPINECLNAYPNGVAFTAQTQMPESVCNYCLGNGYFTGSMA